MRLRYPLLLLILAALTTAPTAAQTVTVTTITPEFNASGGVSVGPDGNAYVADFGATLSTNGGNTIYRVEPDGTTTVFATGFVGASGNAFDAAGNLYQSNIGAGRISKVTPAGVVSTYATTNIAGPVGVAVDADGNVYNTNCVSGAGYITKTTPAQVTTVFSQSALMSCPNGLTIDANGNLYTANFNDGRIVKIAPGGTASLLATLSTAPIGNGHLTFAHGRLYVCNWSGRIYEVLLDGTSRVLAGTGQLGTTDGPGDQATFYRPNGISASVTGDTLYINQSTQVVGGTQLHPNVVRMITGVLATVDVEDGPDSPDGFGLLPNTPNPFGTSTRLGYTLARPGSVALRVYNLLGQRVRTLVDAVRPSGEHTVMWDGRNDAGDPVASGIYLYALEGPDRRTTRPMVLLR
ncbi:MAG: hypothetical protein HKN04_14205 [Rhodothermaceae bacterium]|nr:hypothetical protein [Rhodothermaceae bacterium]